MVLLSLVSPEFLAFSCGAGCVRNKTNYNLRVIKPLVGNKASKQASGGKVNYEVVDLEVRSSHIYCVLAGVNWLTSISTEVRTGCFCSRNRRSSKDRYVQE